VPVSICINHNIKQGKREEHYIKGGKDASFTKKKEVNVAETR
jgi:hypothetical protein